MFQLARLARIEIKPHRHFMSSTSRAIFRCLFIFIFVIILSGCTGSRSSAGGAHRSPLPINAEGTLGVKPAGFLVHLENIKSRYTNTSVTISAPAGSVTSGSMPLEQIRIFVLATTAASLRNIAEAKAGSLVTIEMAENLGSMTTRSDGSFDGTFARPPSEKDSLALVVSENGVDPTFLQSNSLSETTLSAQTVPPSNSEVSFLDIEKHLATWRTLRLFVSAATFDGSTAPSQADNACQTEGRVSFGLTTQWKAVISSISADALSRIAVNGIISNTRSTSLGGPQTVANNLPQLWSGTLVNPPNYTSEGMAANTNVWTGTQSSGQRGLACDPMDNGTMGTVGTTNLTSLGWIENTTLVCSSELPVYCIEQ